MVSVDSPSDSNKEQWDTEYRAGRWDYLLSDPEQVRFDVMSGLLHRKGAQSVLDVGCGVGQLLGRLDPRLVRSYTGIDFSAHALQHITSTAIPIYRINADLNQDIMFPDRAYDAILLAEVLYYLQNPMSVVERLAGLLAPSGIMIVSTVMPWQDSPEWTDRISRVWVGLDALRFENLAEFSVRHTGIKQTWRLRVLTPLCSEAP